MSFNEDATAGELDRVMSERKRQEFLKAAGKFPHGPADSALALGDILAVLTEEVGEVARHVCEDLHGHGLDRAALREELIQVAAVAVGWAERCTLELDPEWQADQDARMEHGA